MEASGETRSRRSDGERTRERILERALPLFAELGYAGASIRKIAREAEVNVATLAYHFGDKRGLYLRVVQRLHEDLAAAWPEELPTGAPSEVFGWWMQQVWDFGQAHRNHMRLLVLVALRLVK